MKASGESKQRLGQADNGQVYITKAAHLFFVGKGRTKPDRKLGNEDIPGISKFKFS